MNENNENSKKTELELTNFGKTPLEGHEMREVLRRAHVRNLDFAKFCGAKTREWTYAVYQNRYISTKISEALREFLGEQIFEAILADYRKEIANHAANRKRNKDKSEKLRS